MLIHNTLSGKPRGLSPPEASPPLGMKVFNTLSGKKEEFKPLKKGQASMYVCGVTTYDYTHLGHARTYVSFDVIRRYLQFKGLKVTLIQNVTDVDDKIINRAKETSQNPIALSAKFDSLSREDFSSLSILPADSYPKVTENIPKIIEFIGKLIASGAAYKTSSGIYFSVEKFKNYGKLSHQDMAKIKSGSRIEIDEKKKNPADFALWKLSPENELGFPSPFGRGRPGWHIECSTLSTDSLGSTIDMHGGARDLIFPHHENEIAQSECATHKKFVKYWMHTGFLTVNGEKMAKSLGNFITIQDALKKYDSLAIRLFFIQTHYRSPIDFSPDAIIAANTALAGIHNTLHNAKEEISSQKTQKNKVHNTDFENAVSQAYSEFIQNMDDDFDTPNALASLFRMVSLTNSHLASKELSFPSLKFAVEKIEAILGIFALLPKEGKKLASEPLQKLLISLGTENPPAKAEKCMEKLIELRDKARKEKNYALSDKIRSELAKLGVTLEDSQGKTSYKLVRIS